MKIACPKCQSAYRVDLPDPGEAGIDVQCGKCLYIFLFTREDIEQSSNAVNQRGIPDLQSRASDLTENHPAEPILSPQKEQEQEVSRDKRKAPEAKKQAPSSQETPDELELELIPEDPEALEIVIEEEPPDDSLEEDALDEIWNQAVEEGTRTQPETQEKSPAPRSDAPIKQETTPTWEEAFADQARVEARWRQAQETSQIREEQQLAEALGVEYTPPEPTPIEELVKKPSTENQQELVDRLFAEAKSKEASKKMRPAKRLPTSEERHREVDNIVAREQTRQKTPKKTPLKKKSQPLPSMDDRQRDIDLIIFRHQTLQEKTGDRPEPDTSSPLPSMDERQREIDEYIIAQRAKLKPPKDKTPEKEPTPPLPSLEERHRDVDSLVDRERAKRARETTQEDIDLEEEVSVDKEEAMPSWEEAFAHQTEVEADWRRAQEQDRIQEEQQLAEAMGEEYVPTEPPEATAAPATPENKQALVDDVFAQMKAQAQETSKKTPETAAPKSKMEKRQDEVDQVITEAKTRQSRETTQEDIDLEEEVSVDKEKAMPSWEEAFAHQAEVEADWRRAKEQDRIQEEQQLAEAMGEEYVPTEPPEATAAPATPENKQALVDDVFAQMKAQAQTASEPEAEEAPAASTEEAEEEYEPTWTDAFSDQAEIETTWKDPPEQEALEASGEASSTPEKKEATSSDSTSSSDIDITADLIDLDMKQLVEQAFKEESDETAASPPAGETAPEPELTLETEASQEAPADSPAPVEAKAKPAPEETSPTEQTVPVAQTEEPDQNIDEIIDHYANYVDPPAAPEPETEPLPELTLESAEESSSETAEKEPAKQEPVEAITPEEPVLELETTPDTMETPAPAEAQEPEPLPELTLESAGESSPEPVEEEPVVTEPEPLDAVADALEQDFEEASKGPQAPPVPQETAAEAIPELEIEAVAAPELELEPTVEPDAATAQAEPAATEKPALGDDEGEEEVYRDEELWAELFPDENKEGQPAAATAEKAPPEKEEPFGGGDFWDQVLEKEPEAPPADTAEPAAMTASTAQRAPAEEALTDEELWSQAFPDDEEIEPAAIEPGPDRKETGAPSTAGPVAFKAERDDKLEDLPELDEAAYADYDDDDDEDFEYQLRKRKLGPFTIPRGRRGDLVAGGAALVFLLLAGGVYFTLQTFAPDGLTDMQTAQTEVPEGLTPRGDPLDDLTGDLTSPKPPDPGKTQTPDTPGDKGAAILSDPAKILEASPEEKGILKDLAESKILKDTGQAQADRVNQSSLLASGTTSVTMSTIIPVAYNPTDIRVLSFSVEIQLSDARSAKQVRESLPVYEAIMTQTVEDFLSRKFYNDILYVKENLQKRLHTAMNKSIKNGRVKKTKFVDFAIQ